MQEKSTVHLTIRMLRYPPLILAGFSLCLGSSLLLIGRAMAQSELPDYRQQATPAEAIPESRQPPTNPDKQVLPGEQVQPLAAGQYVVEFNRSPVVGSRLQLRGIYDESRLRFTRPRHWQIQKSQIALRFRHSPALYATRSNLSVLVNGVSVGSVPLNQKEGKIGTAVYSIPPNILQDYNEVVVAALQNNSPTCTQDPFDPSLWTELLPDSKLVFDYQPQPIRLDFSQYPFPLFDELSLNPNQVAYLLPSRIDEAWLTATTRFHTALGRLAQFRPLNTRLVSDPTRLQAGERLMVIGTPQTQPALKTLKLPLSLQGDRWLDERRQKLADDVGVLMLAPSADQKGIILVATGNTPAAVSKAVQFLLQRRDQQIGSGQIILVKQISDVPTPPTREWPGYLPINNEFELKDLKTHADTPFPDVTTRGSDAPPIEFDFRALPDDHFLSGNVLHLRYSYGPQLNPLTSLLEVQLDGLPLAGRKLDAVDGARQASLRVELPADKIKPNSKIQVRFQLDPRERRSCNRPVDQHLWGTVHASSRFELKRENIARVPDLKLLQTGYPFTAPQDLSQLALVVPNSPSQADLLVLLTLSERLGRISRAESVKLDVYRAQHLPSVVRDERHLVAIGTASQFPLPDGLKAEGFTLYSLFERRRDQAAIRTLPDVEGVVKQIVSPWNRDRLLLLLTAQTATGLKNLQDIFIQDSLFYQLREDTVLISQTSTQPTPEGAPNYTLEFLQQAKHHRRLSETPWQERAWQFLGGNWFLLIPGMLTLGLLLYGIAQASLNRYTALDKSQEK